MDDAGAVIYAVSFPTGAPPLGDLEAVGLVIDSASLRPCRAAFSPSEADVSDADSRRAVVVDVDRLGGMQLDVVVADPAGRLTVEEQNARGDDLVIANMPSTDLVVELSNGDQVLDQFPLPQGQTAEIDPGDLASCP